MIAVRLKVLTTKGNHRSNHMARVVIVDDARFMRLVLRRILMQAGHSIVAEGKDGVEAIKLWAEKRPDCMNPMT
ncbi:MAG: response regulator [Candidatus Heimdallarchaeota archaeon]|nr:response regulator [Candidatus Heimdallarchaeota archaeon]